MAQQVSSHNSSDESTVMEVPGPTQAERFFFDNNGYLILEDFLKEDHVNALTEVLFRVVARRPDCSMNVLTTTPPMRSWNMAVTKPDAEWAGISTAMTTVTGTWAHLFHSCNSRLATI